MILHTLNRSPLDSSVYLQALAAMTEADCLLLIEDGVLGCLPAQAGRWPQLTGRVFALREDLASRGLVDACSDSITVIDIQEFVALTEQATKVVSWY
ncbi:MAG: sulfurtransferase complex subunit TusB [Pseudomonadota bacterium]|nr:sulfurtransferase complex subunit TusB [Pseudomonadota bacterium]